MAKEYCELCFLEPAQEDGLKVSSKKLDIDSELIEKLDLSNIQEDKNIDNILLSIAKEEPKNKDSLMALRCRVSHSIVQKISLIYKQFSKMEDIELSEMLVILLDDSGENYLRIPINELNKKRSFIKKVFCWETIQNMQSKNNIKPFSAEIISEFNSSLSNLNTWTKNKVQGSSQLKSYLIKRGVLLKTTWSLIADSSNKRILEAWNRCGEGKFQTSYIKKLHESYIKEYKKAKTIYKEQTGKISGWQPDEEFLKSLNPPQQNKEALLTLGKAIRKYLTGVYKPIRFENDLESKFESFDKDIEDEPENNLITKIDLILKSSGESIIKELINQDKKKWDKDKSRKLAWKLYSQGLSQREIASRCAHKQAWVSKLIPEKKIAESVAQDAAIILLRVDMLSSLKNDIYGIERLVESLKNHFINSELNVNGPLLKQLIKEAIE